MKRKVERPHRSIQELDFRPKGAVHPSPKDWRDHFIYFLLIDRFDDGKRHPAWDGREGTSIHDAGFGARPQGGKIKGVTRRLPYLKKMGVTALWLSPICKNRVDPGGVYHGYAIQDFLSVDPRIGTKDDLKELVRRAHALGIYIFLDIVINHTGDNWAYPDDASLPYRDGSPYPFGFWRARSNRDPASYDGDDAVWPAELQSPECYERKGAIVDWNDAGQAVHADFYSLKALNLSNPVALEAMIACYKYWIAECDIDGYRIDTVKHVEIGPAVQFFNAIKEYAASIGKQNFFLFGEISGGDEVIRSYVGRQAPRGEHLQALDAALDFPLHFVLEEVIKGFTSPELLRDRLARARAMYPSNDTSGLFVTFLDNHDQSARPFRRFLHGGADPRQAVSAMAYLLTSPGIPTIYYGTEQGFDGGGPPQAFEESRIRECMFGGNWGAFGTKGMHFFNERHPLYKGIARIAKLRQVEPALRLGRMYFREVSEDGASFRYPAEGYGMLAYSRILDDTELLIVINLRGTPYANHIVVDRFLSPPGTLMIDLLRKGSAHLVEDRSASASVEVALPPYGISILKQKTSKKG